MRSEEIKQLIETHLKETTAIVQSEDDQHFRAIVISPLFANKTRIESQQLVYGSLNPFLQTGAIHAISIKTFLPEQWAHQQSEYNG